MITWLHLHQFLNKLKLNNAHEVMKPFMAIRFFMFIILDHTINWNKKKILSGRVVWTTWDRTRTAMVVASAQSNPGQAPSLRYTLLYCTVLYCAVYSREHVKTIRIQVSRSTPCRSKLFKFFWQLQFLNFALWTTK